MEWNEMEQFIATTCKPQLAGKLNSVRQAINSLQKDKKGYNYSYVSEEAAVIKLHAALKASKVNLLPEIVPGTVHWEKFTYEKWDKNQKAMAPVTEVIVSGELTYTFVDLEEEGSTYTVPWYFVGQMEDAAQAFGAGLTYSNRYFLLKFFLVATSMDDPDTIRSRQKEEEELQKVQAANEALQETIDSVVETIRNGIEAGLFTREAALKIVAKYTPDKLEGDARGNPRNLKSLKAAENVIKELNSIGKKGDK